MATNSFESLCTYLYNEIFLKLERREDERLRFAPRGTTKRILHDHDGRNLKDFFRSLDAPDQSSSELFQLPESLFVERVKERKLYDFLGTLVFASCSISAARTFVRELVAVHDSEWPVLDQQGKPLGVLPANRTQLQNLFQNVVDADKFLTKQGCFCAVVLRNKDEVKIEDLDCQRLPYLEETPVGEGSFGKVFRVVVAKGHFRDHSDPAFPYNVKPKAMARKDYVIADTNKAREEYEIMRQILNSTSRKCDNIVESLGCLEIGNSYSLFMPLAICDLRAYIMVEHPNGPKTKEAREEIILCAAGLASGLHFLHNGIKTVELDDLVCYHMDLNPSNVLIFGERADGGERIRQIWKLSDFGMARVKVRRHGHLHGHESVRENDFNSLFIRRKKIHDPSVSGTINRRGEGTYLPPESIASTPTMKTSSDVWALGCVISVVLTYMAAGAEGVRQFQDARGDYERADEYDRFFLRGHTFSRAEVHPEVKAWHRKLKATVMKQNVTEGQAIAFMLDFLEGCVLKVAQEKRCSAKAVKLELEKTFKMYREANDARRGSLPYFLQEPPGKTTNRLGRQPDLGSNVDEWYPASLDDFKGCAISPDANLVAYWTDTKIALYTSQCLLSRERHKVKYSSEHTLTETDCFLKSVCLTNKYLIASTTGRNRLGVFDLEGGTPVDFNLESVRRLSLRLPTIHKIAVSPNSRRIVFVTRDASGDSDQGTLFHAALSDLINFVDKARRPSSQDEDNAFRDAGVPVTQGTEWLKSIELPWSAADVVQLSLSNENDVYIVVRPELTASSREHKIPIIHLYLGELAADRLGADRATMDILNVVSRGFDGGSMAGFFTTFAPFPNKDTCAVITREKRFQIQRFYDSIPTHELQQDIPTYRISRLLTNKPDGRLLAVGTKQAKHQMLLLEIQVEPKLFIEERARLPGLSYGDDFSAVLSDSGPDQCVIIASLAGASRRIIYRVKLPPAQSTT